MNDHQNLLQGRLGLMGISDALMSPETMAGRVHNMSLTREGTWRSVVGPAEYRPRDYVDNGGSGPTVVTYNGPWNGVFHCLLRGGLRDVLLVHFDGGVHELNGSTKGFDVVVGEPIKNTTVIGGTPSTNAALEEDGDYGFLTQFVGTPNGVIIVPRGERAYFYDGEWCAPLGFEEVPSAPTLSGPKSWFGYSADGEGDDMTQDYVNMRGYAHTRRTMNPNFGYSRMGTTRSDVINVTNDGIFYKKKANKLGGVLEAGEWRGRVQYQDRWGNLSALGQPSAPVRFEKEENLTKSRKKDGDESVNAMKGQVLWTDIPTGPDHAFVRDLYSTRDLVNSGDPAYYWIPPNATNATTVLATLPDNDTQVYPANVPDSWLVRRGKDYVPVPRFTVACLAFGRLAIGNFAEDPSAVRLSEPGFWGTFPDVPVIRPDPTGEEVTALHSMSAGLLVFTRRSTYLVQQSGDVAGDVGFVTGTIHPNVGAVSPDTVQTLPNGMTVWLGEGGWYGWLGPGDSVRRISGPVDHSVVRRINFSRAKRACASVDPVSGEYRCWVPVDGSQTNNLCVVFNGATWSTRDDVNAYAVCTTRDHRQMQIVLGKVGETPGLWAMDHEADTESAPELVESVIETVWLRQNRMHRKTGARRLQMVMRETRDAKVDVEVMRDWREHPVMTSPDTAPDLLSVDDPPPLWGTATYGSTYTDRRREQAETPAALTRRRPMHIKYDMMLPSVETFRVRMRTKGDFEFIGLYYQEDLLHKGNADTPKGQ